MDGYILQIHGCNIGWSLLADCGGVEKTRARGRRRCWTVVFTKIRISQTQTKQTKGKNAGKTNFISNQQIFSFEYSLSLSLSLNVSKQHEKTQKTKRNKP